MTLGDMVNTNTGIYSPVYEGIQKVILANVFFTCLSKWMKPFC